MVHTVGLVGANGRAGNAAAKHLATAAGEGKINLVLFQRDDHPLKDFTAGKGIEVRSIDLDGPFDALESTVKGIQVFISALGFGALPSEGKLVDALAASKDIVTYVPSVYSAPWTSEDEADEALGPVIKFLHGGWDRAKERGVGATPVFVGTFEDFFFEIGFVGSPIKGNTVWATKEQLKHKFPVTLIDHLGRALAEIATSDPQSVKNKEFSIVSYWLTGQDFMDLYTKLNGKQAENKDFTSADRDAFRADGPNFGPAKAGFWDHWQKDDWAYESDGRVMLGEYPKPPLEEVAKQFV